ncbi:PREDICTED: uncharacterized protein LOC104763293 [Camelina sativa]|uniref:Uncharacterized protein LOC104763293 n=1 Tax=Camelina sativa TaxID=90675 RepID=A0ABM0XF17_CAMSA|nr:PREDICTED: uncharacterized protein LOC104763293 [Camelina sativa]
MVVKEALFSSMGDNNPPQRSKDLGSPSIQCPMLTSTNYTVWSMRMKITLRVSEVWDTIEPGSADVKMNDVVNALLFQSIPETLILQIGEQNSTKNLWEAIKSRHQGADRVKEARLQTLKAELDQVTMGDSESVDEYAGKMSGLAAQSASLGEAIDETKLVKKFLSGLPREKFIHIVASLEQVLNLNTTTFEDIVGRIKAYEERVGKETLSEDQGKLMFSNTNYRGGYGGFRGGARGRGDTGRGSFGRGRGRGRDRFNGQNQVGEISEKDQKKKDLTKIVCWRCDKSGLYASRCPDKPLQHHETNLNETQEAEALYVHEVVFLNEDKVFPDNSSVWYLDNGASNHMTGNREFFSSLDEKIKGRVKFGDGSYVNIIGKGSIVFVTKSGERRALKEIYYISDLKHNIISLGQATENGFEVKMKGNTLTLSDSYGRLLVQVVRSPNRLYKTPLEIIFQKCLSIQEEEARWTWHARLGHINVGVMNNMVRKDMVVGMPQVLR